MASPVTQSDRTCHVQPSLLNGNSVGIKPGSMFEVTSMSFSVGHTAHSSGKGCGIYRLVQIAKGERADTRCGLGFKASRVWVRDGRIGGMGYGDWREW